MTRPALAAENVRLSNRLNKSQNSGQKQKRVLHCFAAVCLNNEAYLESIKQCECGEFSQSKQTETVGLE